MRFTPALLLLATAIDITTAAPTADPLELSARSQDAKNEYVDVEICSKRKWEDCADIRVRIQNTCHTLIGTTLKNKVNSIQIPSGYRCRFWSSIKCRGDSTPDINTSEWYDLPSGMEDKANSIKCYKN
ncbi:hypothetical protein N7457_003196 [Penicillium paradoxum]|uniref:uncharacterized protein n=1 Tax=Penicillium paradoxum TaxID=176176 RepID=UPI0025497302|nr:uncharacterized protein N7457_003196 [Penicillium paradoxum]KAJ5788206.1 hypothetical protein N7457_003196 [Penicillium paradoxum]